MWVIRRQGVEKGTQIYEVGHYQPYADGGAQWRALISVDNLADAAQCVNYLNGGGGAVIPEPLS